MWRGGPRNRASLEVLVVAEGVFWRYGFWVGLALDIDVLCRADDTGPKGGP